jgi:hypothetical protein
LAPGDGDDEGAGGGKYAKGRARQTISDKRSLAGAGKKKKSTMNVRTALLYRKNLATLIEESVRVLWMPDNLLDDTDSHTSMSEYSLSSSTHPNLPYGDHTPRSVSCTVDVLSLRILGTVQMQAVCNAIL